MTIEARRPWYSPGSTPPLPPLSARRAYLEVLGVYGAFFATAIVGAALLLGDRAKDLTPHGSWALYMSQVVDIVSQIGLAVAVVLLLASRRAVTPAALGLRLPRRSDGRLAVSQTVRIGGWAFLALIVGGVINAALQSGHLPLGRPSAPELIFGVADSLQAGIIEELVVLAFVVVTLRQAGRPLWEITLVALVLRGAYHIYYGPGVFGILVWAAIYYWLYLRFGQLLPLIVCHALWDTVGFLSERWSGVAAGGIVFVVLLWVVCIVLWLTSRGGQPALAGWPGYAGYSAGPPVSGGVPGQAIRPVPASWPPTAGPHAAVRPAVPPPGLPPAGWHPDPGGENRWRWWDGQAWTEHVSTHPA